MRLAHLNGGNACISRVRRNIAHYHGTSTNLCTIANVDVAKQLCVGAKHHAVPNFRVTVASFVTRTAERYAMQKAHIVADHGGFANAGIYNGMNKGIVKATGDYLNFMNSGDCFYDADVLQRVAAYPTEGADIIVGRDYHYSEKKQQGHTSIQPSRVTMMHFFVATLDHQSSFIRRELFAGSPYDESHRLVSDWIFYVEKIVGEGRQVQFIPDIVCRREEGGLSEQQRERNRSEIDAYLHQLLAPGIYADYATLSKLDKTSLYKLYRICDNNKMRKALVFCIKLINKLYHYEK